VFGIGLAGFLIYLFVLADEHAAPPPKPDKPLYTNDLAASIEFYILQKLLGHYIWLSAKNIQKIRQLYA
jgi:hypothetical protein